MLLCIFEFINIFYLSVGFNALSGDGGAATSAGFKTIYCISFDLEGNLFVGSSAPYVRAVEKSDMIVNTIAGGSKKYSAQTIRLPK